MPIVRRSLDSYAGLCYTIFLNKSRRLSGGKARKRGDCMILIFGCGILGRHLLRALPDGSETIAAVNAHAISPAQPLSERIVYRVCDVRSGTDLAALAAFCGSEPLTVYYFAAMHNIDAVFTDPAAAYAVNVDGLRAFLSCGLSIRQLFFASTDCVYGENDALHPRFGEDDPLHPINVYGAQKAEAEQIVRAHGFTVLRFPFLFGPSLCEKPNFYDTSVRKLQSGTPIDMIDGMTRSALSYRTAAQLLVRLSALPLPAGETINVCGDRGFGKYEIGLLLAEKVGCSASLVHKLSAREGERFFKDRRADSACMDNTKLKRLLGLQSIELEV